MRAESTAGPVRPAPVALELSVVIPVHNEEGNLGPLLDRLVRVLQRIGAATEVVVVDDGSTDGTPRELEVLRRTHPELTVIRLRRCFGKSAAYMAGFRRARGRVLVTMDGDGQDDPEDIPSLIAALEQGFDVVSGWKRTGKGPWSKRLPSRVFNFVTAGVTGIPLHDFNCPLKAYRRHVVRRLHLYRELHRFIPVLAHQRGYRLAEVPVANHPRLYGRSKYGPRRFVRGFLDLLTILFITRYTRRPLHFFGVFGILIFLAGFGIALYLLLLKMLTGMPFSASFPLLLFSILLMVLGFQTFSLGLICDLLLQWRDHPDYVVESVVRGGERVAEQ